MVEISVNDINEKSANHHTGFVKGIVLEKRDGGLCVVKEGIQTISDGKKDQDAHQHVIIKWVEVPTAQEIL